LTEPGAGSDVGDRARRPRREGDEYVLKRREDVDHLADTADNFLFFAGPYEEKAQKPGSLRHVLFHRRGTLKGSLRERFTASSVSVRGTPGSFFARRARAKGNLVGEEGEGFKIAMFALEQGRFTVAAGATGVIRASRDASVGLR